MSCTLNPIKNEVVNTRTAKLCHDYELPGRRIHQEPDPKRPLMRLLAVLAVAAMTVWAIEYIAMNHTSGLQEKKVKGEPLEVAQAYFPPLPPGSILNATEQPDPNVTCPCKTNPTIYHWCKFINFSIILCNKATNNLPKVIMISTSSNVSTPDDSCNRPANLNSLCQDFQGADLQTGCINAINTVFDFFQSQMPHVYTPTLSTSLDVHDRVGRQMLANIDTHNKTTQPDSTKNSQVVNVFSPATSYNDTMLALLLLQSMVLQVFDGKTDSTPQEFWDRGMSCGWNMYPEIGDRMNGSKFVFGMSVDYVAYSNQYCKPNYCYKLEEEGLTTRFMYAFSEVGGAWSLIALGIRFILWPLVAMIFRFPHAPSLDPFKVCKIGRALAGDSEA